MNSLRETIAKADTSAVEARIEHLLRYYFDGSRETLFAHVARVLVHDSKLRDAVHAAIEAAGFAVVPVEPTEAMERAAIEQTMARMTLPRREVSVIWRAMRAASGAIMHD